jgi:flagellar P-ring protein precursor FlgI
MNYEQTLRVACGVSALLARGGRSLCRAVPAAFTQHATRTAIALVATLAATELGAQTKIRDLTLGDESTPVRLVGYGIAVGLDGTGDRGTGGRTSGQTVQSIANLLRRFDVNVPPELLRTRNVAAVLVTAEVSPYLRAGGRFEVHVSSIGDATSLKGGVLWMTPLVTDAGAAPVATAQGSMLTGDGDRRARRIDAGGTTARIPSGGVIEGELPRPLLVAAAPKLLLREPDLVTATRIAAAVDSVLGQGTAKVDDPGSVSLTLKADVPGGPLAALARLRDVGVQADRRGRLVIDGRDGTVVAGGDITVGEATVSHAGITLTIGAATAGAPGTAAGDSTALHGDVRMPAGSSVQRIAAALHAVRTNPGEVAAIFTSLREVGAISAEVVVR